MTNYCLDNRKRNPETERMVFDILHCALLKAETAVKIMKQKQRNEEEYEKKRALEGTNVSGQVAPDSAEGDQQTFISYTICKIVLARKVALTLMETVRHR